MNINYKITSLALVGLLVITYAWHWQDIFNHGDKMGRDNMEMSGMKMGGMQHTMPDGTVMGGDSMMMKKEDSMSMESMMTSMNANLKGKSGKELERAFLAEMIPHHEGAVVMAQAILVDKTVRPELTKLATEIVSAQQTEIAQMKKWLAEYK